MDSDKPMMRIPPCIIYLGSIPMLALGKVHEPHYYKSWKLALASKNVRLGTVAALQSSGALSRNRKRPVFLFCQTRTDAVAVARPNAAAAAAPIGSLRTECASFAESRRTMRERRAGRRSGFCSEVWCDLL